MKCETCGRYQKGDGNSDCVFNECMCDDCYSKYNWHAMIGNVDFLGETEADARAKMLIYLVENKLIKV